MNHKIMNKLITLIAAVLLLNPMSGSAQVQKWIDADGKTHYGAQPPQGAKTQSMQGAVSTIGSTAVASDEVVLYSTTWCGYCKKARKYMAKNGINYKEYDIEKSLSAKLEYERSGGRGVPFLVKDGKTIRGFSEGRYDQFFAQR